MAGPIRQRTAGSGRLPDDRHVCLVSGSRGGKGTTSIVNNLFLWPGSICCRRSQGRERHDHRIPPGQRIARCEGLGQAVQVLDPLSPPRSTIPPWPVQPAGYPRPGQRRDHRRSRADCRCRGRHTRGHDPFWDESGRAMVKGLILHVLTAPKYEGRRNLTTVRKLVTRGDSEAAETLRDRRARKRHPCPHSLLWAALANNPAFGGLVAGIGDMFTNMLEKSPKQYRERPAGGEQEYRVYRQPGDAALP